MEKQGFMPHSDRFPLLSRDWEDIDCKAMGCDYNIDGKCGVPSLAKVGEDGRCEGFKPKGSLKVKKGTGNAG